MAILIAERTARKPHKCSQCLGTIRPGERYASIVATPGDSDIGNIGWSRVAEHRSPGECWYESRLLGPGEENPPEVPWEDQAIPETTATAGEEG